MNTFQVRFDGSKYPAETEAEAREIALGLIDARCPFEARVIEIDEDGEMIRTVVRYNASNAPHSSED